MLFLVRIRMEEAEKERRRWVWNRGLRMGKQILVAGLLASSAPVVVPPLLVVSVLGISVSIPFGLFLVSHACTHRLMRKLFPMPTTPPYAIEACRKEYVDPLSIQEGQTTRGIEMCRVKGFANKDEPQLSQHTIICEETSPGAEDRERMIVSQKPIPSVKTADETNAFTIDLHRESSNAMVNVVAYMQNPTQSQYSTANNNEVMVNEEKLWKEINAIRVIIGYEGTPQASCIDELKNLYIVAGVEPPSLFNVSCNPFEVYDKLHFLMSILGVKSNGP